MPKEKNMEKKPEFHGSDLEKIAEYYHINQDDIISFGANVNPLGLSDALKRALTDNLDVITRYPDRNYTSLKKAISQYTDVAPEHIVVGNGSTELISLLISQRRPKKALILGPTYSEYERELALTGGTLAEYDLKECEDFQLDIEDFTSSLTDDIELVIICNPNNPTSSAISCHDMERIIAECQKRDIFLMIDETYVEFAPNVEEISAVPLAAKYDNFMVIRGVSKFFAAPGLRFGYGITSNEKFLKSLLTHQNPWSLNSIGAFAGEFMLQDTEYMARTRELILTERSKMMAALSEMPAFQAYKPYGNFILVRILKEGVTSFDVFERAICENLMIRDCASFSSLEGEYIRFCMMMPEDNKKLMEVLRTI